ncbi:hypothetical protein KPL39_02050 [Clostridium gasigenes]|uniref:hypothetical protein n=1 Tax=Clostridium gasigenes TaxID=94869 RepID=UPI001C0E7322|nr:hypothetical protein [Clostridium gasigenes]MBU3135043.1 hypothetical protein [Clostridium gasigenes]
MIKLTDLFESRQVKDRTYYTFQDTEFSWIDSLLEKYITIELNSEELKNMAKSLESAIYNHNNVEEWLEPKQLKKWTLAMEIAYKYDTKISIQEKVFLIYLYDSEMFSWMDLRNFDYYDVENTYNKIDADIWAKINDWELEDEG